MNRGDRTGQAFPRGSVGTLSSQGSWGQTWPERVRSVARPIKGRRVLPPAIGEHVRPVVRPSRGRRLLQPSFGAESSKRSRLFSALTLLARSALSQGPFGEISPALWDSRSSLSLNDRLCRGNAKGHVYGEPRGARDRRARLHQGPTNSFSFEGCRGAGSRDALSINSVRVADDLGLAGVSRLACPPDLPDRMAPTPDLLLLSALRSA